MGKNLTLSYSKPKQNFQKKEHHLGCEFQIRRRDDANSRFFSGFYVPFFGGIERYTYNISKKLVARGYRVIIITSKHSNDLSHESIEEGIKIYRLPIYNFGKKRYPFPRKNKTYKELLKKN